MRRFIARRLLTALGVLALTSVAVFLLVAAAPGDPAKLVAEKQSGVATRQAVERARHELKLDRPLVVRYGDWAAGMAQGDLGRSIRTDTPIGSDLAARVPVTLLLVAGGAAFVLLVGVGAGIAGALWPGGIVDRLLRPAALVGVSIPTFYLGALLVLLFSVSLHWFPAAEEGGVGSWILPWITLGLGPAGVMARVVRVGLAEAMARPYVTTALSKGRRRRAIVVRDALPNVAVPVLTAFFTQAGLMVVGAIVVESLFSWQGAALYFLEAIKFRDYPVLTATLFLFAALFVLLNAAVDILNHLIDPRLRRATSETLA